LQDDAEKLCKRQVLVRPSNNVIVIFSRHGYTGEFEIVDYHCAQRIVIGLEMFASNVVSFPPTFNAHIVLQIMRMSIQLKASMLICTRERLPDEPGFNDEHARNRGTVSIDMGETALLVLQVLWFGAG